MICEQAKAGIKAMSSWLDEKEAAQKKKASPDAPHAWSMDDIKEELEVLNKVLKKAAPDFDRTEL